MLVGLWALLLGTLTASAATAPRFFFSGDGRLVLRDAHGGRALDVRFRRADGSYDRAALGRIRRLLRSRDGKESDIALRTIELLDYVDARFKPRGIKVVSGYRSPSYNARLRDGGALAAQASLHTQGLAVDVMLAGVKLRAAWDELRELQAGGFGLYEQQRFLHVDSGPARFWEPATSKVGDDISAGNARVFARTDFDLYTAATLVGAAIDLHGVTALPLRIEPSAGLSGAEVSLRLAPSEGLHRDADGCLRVDEHAPHIRVTIAEVRGERPTAGRHKVRLSTCPPRVESTPETIEGNEIEIESAR